MQIESSYSSCAAIVHIFDPNKPKYRCELLPCTTFWPCERFVRNDSAETKIKSRRLASENYLEFKQKLGLDPNRYSFVVLMNNTL